MLKTLAVLALATSVVLGLAACGGAGGKSGVTISKADFGKAWPFTVPDGILRCKDGVAITFEHGGTKYAVNGSAKSLGFADIAPIWADDPSPLGGPKKDLGPINERGQKLC